MKITRSTTKIVVKVLLIATTSILGIIWWINGMEDTWLYLSNVLIVLTVFWATYPKEQKDESD